jgi:Arc/MetJ-type ribon-helix-helix transcriptional regulator
MRSIINISVPAELAAQVKKEAKKHHFSSTSEFFRHLWRLYQTEKTVRDVRISKKQFAQGKGKVLKSLRNLG